MIFPSLSTRASAHQSVRGPHFLRRTEPCGPSRKRARADAWFQEKRVRMGRIFCLRMSTQAARARARKQASECLPAGPRGRLRAHRRVPKRVGVDNHAAQSASDIACRYWQRHGHIRTKFRTFPAVDLPPGFLSFQHCVSGESEGKWARGESGRIEPN